jgi:hypothetical protein
MKGTGRVQCREFFGRGCPRVAPCSLSHTLPGKISYEKDLERATAPCTATPR